MRRPARHLFTLRSAASLVLPVAVLALSDHYPSPTMRSSQSGRTGRPL